MAISTKGKNMKKVKWDLILWLKAIPPLLCLYIPRNSNILKERNCNKKKT